MTHRDGLPRFSARSVRRGDAGHREAHATLSKMPSNLGWHVRLGIPKICHKCGVALKEE